MNGGLGAWAGVAAGGRERPLRVELSRSAAGSERPLWHGSDVTGGQSYSALPGSISHQPVGYGESVVNLNAQIAHRALYAVELDCLVPRAGP
jgi:hypothetical protein